jgi:SnoaL-like domain
VSEADVITRLLHAVDRLDWVAVRDCFTDVVATDYTSLWGGEPGDQRADELITQWQEFTATLSATQHQTGPIVFADGQAETHVIAYHWLLDGGDLWVVHGHYVARIDDGRIAALTLQTISSYGHAGLPSIGPRRP